MAVRDFSGLVNSAWALARAAASVPICSLDGAWLASRYRSKLIAPDFERLARMPCPEASLASSGTSSSALLWRARAPVRRPGPHIGGGKLRPGDWTTHIDDPDGLDPRPRRLDAKQARGFAGRTQRQNFLSAVSRRCW